MTKPIEVWIIKVKPNMKSIFILIGIFITSEISALILWIILIWSLGILTAKPSRANRPLSGSKVEPEASIRGREASWCVSWLELSNVVSAIAVQVRLTNLITGKQREKKVINKESRVLVYTFAYFYTSIFKNEGDKCSEPTNS